MNQRLCEGTNGPVLLRLTNIGFTLRSSMLRFSAISSRRNLLGRAKIRVLWSSHVVRTSSCIRQRHHDDTTLGLSIAREQQYDIVTPSARFYETLLTSNQKDLLDVLLVARLRVTISGVATP
jgi:hypothetical protein